MYLTDDSKLLAADYDQIASTPLPDVLGKTISTTVISTCCRTPSKPCHAVKLDEKTQFIGVVAYFSDDRATEWKQIETVEGTYHHYRLLVHVRQSSIEMKKRMNNYGNHPQQGDVAGRDADAPTPFPATAALQRLRITSVSGP